MPVQTTDLRSNVPTVSAYNTVVAPAAATTFVDSGALTQGYWEVEAWAAYGATADVIDNAALFVADRLVGIMAMGTTAGGTPSRHLFKRVTVANGDHLTIRNIAAGAAGSVYRAQITATRL